MHNLVKSWVESSLPTHGITIRIISGINPDIRPKFAPLFFPEHHMIVRYLQQDHAIPYLLPVLGKTS